MALKSYYNGFPEGQTPNLSKFEVSREGNMQKLTLRINRRKGTIKAEGYSGIYFLDQPKGKYQYYCRHSERDWDKIISVKANLGLTVNFWGTIVTDEPIDFNGKDEVRVTVMQTIDEDGEVID